MNLACDIPRTLKKKKKNKINAFLLSFCEFIFIFDKQITSKQSSFDANNNDFISPFHSNRSRQTICHTKMVSF